MKHQRMERAALGEGVELEYEIRGAGEPVILIHPGHFAAWFAPLLDQPVLTDRYRMVRYHRIGCAGSSHIAGAVSFAQQAAQCRSLMRCLGIDKAHVVGHSSSGLVALQLALDAPEVVQSLALLEPALLSLIPSAPSSAELQMAAFGLYRAGDKAAAVDTFLRGTCFPGYRAVLDKALPGAFDQHVADVGTFFDQEMPALRQWSFTREEARRITCPVLAVAGTKSKELNPPQRERQELLLSWLPNAEPFDLPDATHMLQVENPRGMAEGLAAFFARHPVLPS